MAENQAIDVDEVQESKPAKKAGKSAAGKPPIMMIAALAVAIAAVAFSAFLFMQLNGLRARLEEGGTMEVPGEEADQHADAAHDDHSSHGTENFVVPAEGVLYDLGEITTNTSDNKFVKMAVILEIDSFYDRGEFEVYEAMLEKYKHGVTVYRNYQLGLDEDGNPKDGGDGGHAMLPPPGETIPDQQSRPHGVVTITAGGPAGQVEVTPAMHGAPKAAPPPEMPDKPEMPQALMVIRMMENDSRIRDMIIDEIHRTDSQDFIRPSGKNLFKDNIRIKINDIIGAQYGRVTEVMLPNIVSS